MFAGFINLSVADPGFPWGGGANSPGGAPTYDFAKFSQNCMKLTRIWNRGGRGASKILLCRSATAYGLFPLLDLGSDSDTDTDPCIMQDFSTGLDSDSDPLIEI